MKIHLLWTICLTAVLGAANAHAHHSAQAAFSTNVIEVEGYVTEFNFTNPHVNIFFDVTDESGETAQWMATGLAANLLRRQGWTVDTIDAGQYLRIAGRETRDGSPMILIAEIIELDPRDGTLVRNVQGESDYDELARVAFLPLTLPDGRPNFTGAWTMGPGGPAGRSEPVFNDVGATMQARFDPVSDPAVNCEPPGLVRQAGFTAHPVRVTQNDDHVILEYEAFGGRRVIYFDGREPESDQRTNLGRSVARYDGNTMVIETTQLLGNYTGINGNPLSDQTMTVETYRRMDDPSIGAALALEMVITDPVHLATPWILSWQKYYTLDYQFVELDCRVPFTYREPE